MADQVNLILDELLRFRQAPVERTAEFAALRHNDHLCPTIERQLNLYLDCFLKFHRVAYDVQGPRDRGTDLVLRYDYDGEDRFLIFQVKSFDDLKEKNYLGRLKAQAFEVHSEFGRTLSKCYIVLCTDARQHATQLRNIKKDFATVSWVTIVDPGYAHTFFRLSTLRMNSVVEAILRQEDAIQSAARAAVAALAPLEVALLLGLIWIARDTRSSDVDIRQLVDLPFVRQALESIPDYPRDVFFYDDDGVVTPFTRRGRRMTARRDLDRPSQVRVAEEKWPRFFGQHAR